jgi:rhamnopyranosyl-N-acetylglucosaminyl-diphospho-decaprenol beta-1,3/1,4-galactofuranosyltransferase
VRAYTRAMRVWAVVVTHNRRALLERCLDALAAQTRLADRVLVVDNASSDGTHELLCERAADDPALEVLSLAENGGGAGGFHAGMGHAHAAGADWLWLMDDDTIPEPACLAELLEAAQRAPEPPALLASTVLWTDGRMHPMNWPGFERERLDRVIEAAQRGLLPLRTATFVSLLIAREAIDVHGLPLRDYFLWSDDIEYTARILRRRAGYIVPASRAVHRTERPHTAVSSTGQRFYFHVRNTLFMLRGPAWAGREKPSVLFGLIVSVIEYLRASHFAPAPARVVLRGLRDGLAPGAPVASR